MFKLFGRTGWGSVLIEAQLAWYGLAYALEEVDDLFTSAAARAALEAVSNRGLGPPGPAGSRGSAPRLRH